MVFAPSQHHMENTKREQVGTFISLIEQNMVYRGVETILKVEGHDSYEVKNVGPGVYPRKKFLQTTPFKLRENDTTPSYYA